MARRRRSYTFLALTAGMIIFDNHATVAQEAHPSYRIKPSEVTAPDEVKPGDYQRVIRPFENWTLICDENLVSQRRVCNITQIVEDSAGDTAFSWSLAATAEGKPYMIVRAPPHIGSNGIISFSFEGRKAPVKIHVDGCNETICIGMLPVGPIVREHIAKNADVEISYGMTEGDTIAMPATLKGLSTALQAIE